MLAMTGAYHGVVNSGRKTRSKQSQQANRGAALLPGATFWRNQFLLARRLRPHLALAATITK